MRVHALLAAALLVPAGPLRAQDGGVRYWCDGAPEREREAADYLRAHGVDARPVSAGQFPAAPLDRASLAPLVRAEEALLRARELSGQFAEARALLTLVEAERALGDEGLALPLASRLLAELAVQTAIVSYALGERGLADTALRRATTLDPERRLQAGEAPPELVARARQLERERDGAVRARLTVEVDAPGATVALDGVDMCPAPARLEAAPGAHLLVARAPDRSPYAAVVQLESGERPTVKLALAENGAARAARSLAAGGLDRRPQARQLAAALGADVWLFAPDPDRRRTSVLRCDAAHCSAEEAIAWAAPLGPTVKDEHTPRRGTRWALWLAVGSSIAGGAALALWAARDEHTRRERTVTIDPGTPP